MILQSRFLLPVKTTIHTKKLDESIGQCLDRLNFKLPPTYSEAISKLLKINININKKDTNERQLFIILRLLNIISCLCQFYSENYKLHHFSALYIRTQAEISNFNPINNVLYISHCHYDRIRHTDNNNLWKILLDLYSIFITPPINSDAELTLKFYKQNYIIKL